jgi:hypothetical protein
METVYNSVKGPRELNVAHQSRFGIITLINIYRVGIYKISFSDNTFY